MLKMTMFGSLRRRLSAPELSFLKGSAIIAVGFAVARLLGLGFTLILGRLLPAESYGFIQYTIALAGILTIGTMPFMQHVLARYVSIYRNQPKQLDQVFSTMWILLGAIGGLTLLIVVPVFLLSNQVNVGALIIFLGVTIFYGYYGLARGFESTGRLVAVFVGSNLIQLIAIIVVYMLLGATSTLPALAIYGLSYLPAVALLSRMSPLPVRFHIRHFNRSFAAEVLRFSAPVWVSQTVSALSMGADILLLAMFTNEAVVGAFAFAKTLNLIFDFLAQGVGTIILPRVATGQHNPRRLFITSVGVVTLVSLAILAFYLPLYEWGVRTFFGPGYLVSLNVVIMLALSNIFFSAHTIASDMLIGLNRASIETASRVTFTIILYAAGFILIPIYGAVGAALADLICAVAAVVSLPVLLWINRRWRVRRAEAG